MYLPNMKLKLIYYSDSSNTQFDVISLIGINYLDLLIEILLTNNRNVSTAQDLRHKSYVGSIYL